MVGIIVFFLFVEILVARKIFWVLVTIVVVIPVLVTIVVVVPGDTGKIFGIFIISLISSTIITIPLLIFVLLGSTITITMSSYLVQGAPHSLGRIGR